MIARILVLFLSFVTGAGVGFVLTFTHRQYVVDLGDIPVPLGLIGALAIVAGLLTGMRLAFGDRFVALSAGVGVILASLALMLPAHGGSVLVLEDPIGYAWALGPAAITLVVVGWPAPRRRGSSRSEGALRPS